MRHTQKDVLDTCKSQSQAQTRLTTISGIEKAIQVAKLTPATGGRT